MLLLWLALCAVAGFCAKLVDERADRSLRLPLLAASVFAVLYGVAAGLLSTSSPLSSLFLGLAVAAVLANKFDHPLHLLGLLSFTAVLVVKPIAFFDPWLFALFLTLGLLDELELRLLRPLSFLNAQRLWTPLGALALALWDALNPALSSNWSTLSGALMSLPELPGVLFLLAILCFDLSYRLAGYAGPRYLGSKPMPVAAKPNRSKRRR